jgi:voltage-gated potassium channel
MALPIGIIATAFSDEIHRRDFVVTWGLLAKVPLFSELSASEIAEIMKLLRAQHVENGATIVRRGEPAHSMYLIAAGEVEVRLKHRRIRLGQGHFFGEIAALRRTLRSATVVATRPTSLLALDAGDLESLMDRNPGMAALIREVARGRLADEHAVRGGDLVTEELQNEEATITPQHHLDLSAKT